MRLTQMPFSELHPAEKSGVNSGWKRFRPWLRPLISVLLMGAIFGWMIHKIAIHWADVKGHASEISWSRFAIASVLFATFLFAFRSLVWRRILRGFGYPLPLVPAVRVWISSEMARYIPGVIWQVAGRVYLVKPYGVSASVCAASQVLELVIFLLANILLGVTCLLVFVLRHTTGHVPHWMYALVAMVPLLALVLHPAIFYGAMNRLMRRLKKPDLTNRLSGRELTGLLIWNILGLLLQSLAVFLIVQLPLHLHWDKWYAVTGAYSLAWCVGFLVVWSPAGLGPREAAFIAAMQFALPRDAHALFHSRGELNSFLALLGAILRLWTIAGEVILMGVVYLLDRKGAVGLPPVLIPTATSATPPVSPVIS